MDDLISRKEAIDLLKQMRKDGDMVPWEGKDVFARIRELPAEPHWIPVTEQPPEVGKSVLICDAYGDICLGHRTSSGYYFPDFCEDKVKDVRAWCNLPEPYKGVNV